MLSTIINVFKLRIGLLIALTALAGFVVTPGAALTIWQVLMLCLLVLLSSACAGAFNQYIEYDLDARMQRTQNRPFVTGELTHSCIWLWGLGILLSIVVGICAWMFNTAVAFYIFMGAFFYAIVYTVWLKRRSVFNIVIGGLAGSFAVLGGAAAADPGLSQVSILLAVILFLWTPPHFWSLAIALHKDYAAAKVPMLPVVVGDVAAARIILVNTIMLVVVSIIPFFYGMGLFYLICALSGGVYFIVKSIRLIYIPTRKMAMSNFFASIIQLTLVLTGMMLDTQFSNWSGVF